MKKAFRSSVVFILVLSITMSILSMNLKGFAISLPNAVWKPLDSFAAAVNSGNDEEILKWGEVLIGIMEAEPDSNDKSEFLAGKYDAVAKAAERLGYYEKAVDYYTKYIPYGTYMNWTDGVIFAQKKAYLLSSYLNVYIEDSNYNPPYYNAKFEPERGVLFGAAYDNDERIGDYNQDAIQKYFPKKNSDYLIYLEFGDDIAALPRYQRYFDDAKKNNVAVELAWNTYQPIENPESYKEYIQKTIDYLGNSGLKVFLRFANEMNIGPNGDNPAAYVNAFRYVASYAKTKNNIAMVWSPNDLGALDRPYSNYYPGDEYVDWVGASLYVIQYFQGIKDHGAQTDPLNTYFATGEYANPVLRMHELIQFMKDNNIQKPVMIAEGGVTHFDRPENEDTTAWAMVQMRRMYGDLIRMYPQIKAFHYFDVKMDSEVNAFELYTNQRLNDLYNQLVENPYYLQNLGDTAPYGYRPFEGGMVQNGDVISAVGYYPKTLYNSVRYVIDGDLVQESYDTPYSYQINGLAAGGHTLQVQLYDGGQMKLEKTIHFEVAQQVQVMLDGELVAFADQKPMIKDDRTLVPARGVFEKMGMEVLWDEKTQQVTIKNAKLQIQMRIDQKDFTVNKEKKTMDVPAQLIGGRTMIPLRAVAEATGAKVDWNGAENLAVITIE